MITGRRLRRGSMVMEAALWLPILLLLIVGTVQFGKITYVYYTLKKTLYAAGRYVAVQQGVNFCDLTGDTVVQQALNYALTGATEGSGVSQFPALTTGQISITTECFDASTQSIGACSTSGCDGPGGGQRPDFLVISIPDGYQVQPRIPYILLDPILLRPQIRIPFGGT